MKEAFQKDEVFLAEVQSTAAGRGSLLRLWWLGQSGFLMQCNGRHVLFDPYLSDSLTKKYAGTDKPHVRMSERVVAPERLDFIDVITSSHGHTDHLDGDTLVLICRAVIARQVRYGHLGMEPDLVYPASAESLVATRVGESWLMRPGIDAWEQMVVKKVKFTAVPAAHDTIELDSDGHHRYLGYVCQYRGRTVYHSGDTVVYDGMVEDLKGFGSIDVAMLPINGKVGNMGGVDAARLGKAIGARVVIPCHYDMFEFNTADPFAEFVPECERIGQGYRVLRLGEGWSSAELG